MICHEAIRHFLSWASLTKRFATQKSYRTQLMGFALYVRDKRTSEVTLEDILNYLKDMEKIGWDKNSLMTKCIALRKFFEFYSKQGKTSFDPKLIPVIEREYHMPKEAKPDDFNRFLSVIRLDPKDHRPLRNKAITCLLKDTGARVGEIEALNPKTLTWPRWRA